MRSDESTAHHGEDTNALTNTRDAVVTLDLTRSLIATKMATTTVTPTSATSERPKLISKPSESNVPITATQASYGCRMLAEWNTMFEQR